MDKQATSRRQPGNAPRLMSRLPLPTTYASGSIRPSPSREKLQADPGLNAARLRRPSEGLFKKPLPRSSSPSKHFEGSYEHGGRPQIRTTYGGSTTPEDGACMESFDSKTNSDTLVDEISLPKRPGPSLSDRTIETLAQIPPSPSR